MDNEREAPATPAENLPAQRTPPASPPEGGTPNIPAPPPAAKIVVEAKQPGCTAFAPSLQHDPNRPEDVLNVDADEDTAATERRPVPANASRPGLSVCALSSPVGCRFGFEFAITPQTTHPPAG
jgi:hypothetical protein